MLVTKNSNMPLNINGVVKTMEALVALKVTWMVPPHTKLDIKQLKKQGEQIPSPSLCYHEI